MWGAVTEEHPCCYSNYWVYISIVTQSWFVLFTGWGVVCSVNIHRVWVTPSLLTLLYFVTSVLFHFNHKRDHVCTNPKPIHVSPGTGVNHRRTLTTTNLTHVTYSQLRDSMLVSLLQLAVANHSPGIIFFNVFMEQLHGRTVAWYNANRSIY